MYYTVHARFLLELSPQQISGALYLPILGTAQRALMVGLGHEAHKVDGGCFQVESVASSRGKDSSQLSVQAVNL
jgi:hypothetical protein